MTTPKELKYTKSHEWVRKEPDGTVTVGITFHAQEQLGDVVFVQPPEVGRKVKQGEECAVIDDTVDDLVHVVRVPRIVRHDRVETLVHPIRRIRRLGARRIAEIVLGEPRGWLEQPEVRPDSRGYKRDHGGDGEGGQKSVRHVMAPCLTLFLKHPSTARLLQAV